MYFISKILWWNILKSPCSSLVGSNSDPTIYWCGSCQLLFLCSSSVCHIGLMDWSEALHEDYVLVLSLLCKPAHVITSCSVRWRSLSSAGSQWKGPYFWPWFTCISNPGLRHRDWRGLGCGSLDLCSNQPWEKRYGEIRPRFSSFQTKLSEKPCGSQSGLYHMVDPLLSCYSQEDSTILGHSM